MENILEIIIDSRGNERQNRKAMEELGELITAINKNIDEPKRENYLNLVEEIADTEIMLEQLKIIHDIEENEILEIKEYKIRRELERINKEKAASENFEISLLNVEEVTRKTSSPLISKFYSECTATDFNFENSLLEAEQQDEEALNQYMIKKEREELAKALINFLKGYCNA